MNIKRTISLAAATAIACVGMSTPAMAFTPVTTLSNGPVKPMVVWDHAAWKKCWAGTYAQWREDGMSPTASQNAADLTCGHQP